MLNKLAYLCPSYNTVTLPDIRNPWIGNQATGNGKLEKLTKLQDECK